MSVHVAGSQQAIVQQATAGDELNGAVQNGAAAENGKNVPQIVTIPAARYAIAGEGTITVPPAGTLKHRFPAVVAMHPDTPHAVRLFTVTFGHCACATIEDASAKAETKSASSIAAPKVERVVVMEWIPENVLSVWADTHAIVMPARQFEGLFGVGVGAVLMPACAGRHIRSVPWSRPDRAFVGNHVDKREMGA